MKIVTWNCHYGLEGNKLEQLLNNNNFKDVDIYAIQEAKENDIINLSQFKYRHWYGDHLEYEFHRKRGGDLGLALLSSTYKIKKLEEGLIHFRYVVPYELTSEDGNRLILLHVWTKSIPDYYIDSISKAYNNYVSRGILNKEQKVFIVGDFNWSAQLVNGKEKLEKFKNWMKENNFVSAYHECKKLDFGSEDQMTFSSSSTSKGYHNDFILTKNIKLIKKVEIGDSFGSDHRVVYAEVIL